jgi:hypothetical protein
MSGFPPSPKRRQTGTLRIEPDGETGDRPTRLPTPPRGCSVHSRWSSRRNLTAPKGACSLSQATTISGEVRPDGSYPYVVNNHYDCSHRTAAAAHLRRQREPMEPMSRPTRSVKGRRGSAVHLSRAWGFQPSEDGAESQLASSFETKARSNMQVSQRHAALVWALHERYIGTPTCLADDLSLLVDQHTLAGRPVSRERRAGSQQVRRQRHHGRGPRSGRVDLFGRGDRPGRTDPYSDSQAGIRRSEQGVLALMKPANSATLFRRQANDLHGVLSNRPEITWVARSGDRPQQSAKLITDSY